jgi:hypothetical protein
VRKLSHFCLAAALLGSMAAAGLVLMFAPNVRAEHREVVASHAPSLRDLNASIDAAAGYVESLYRPLGDGRAVTAEYLGMPIRIHLVRSHQWILVGQSRATSAVSRTVSRYAGESYLVSFKGWISIAVAVDWRHSKKTYRIRLHQLGAVSQPIAVYVDQRRLGTALPDHQAKTWSLEVPRVDRTPLRSFRYTVRHGAQLAQNFYRYGRRRERFAARAALISGGRFELNSDLTAPIWGRGVQFADDLPFNAGEAYHDCKAVLPSTATAYPYRSKVCSTSRGLYIWLTRSDPLAPTVAALHALERHHDPDRGVDTPRMPIALPIGADLQAGEPAERSPRQTAAWVESIYRTAGFGVPRCLPARCEDTSASGVRTFEFGALEAMLGYRYGDRISRSYADAVATLALETQIDKNGIIRTGQGAFYRPAAAGSFLFAWDAKLHAYLDKSLTAKVTAALSMPPEYTGIVASNSETSITAYAVLAAYRCLRYHVGCSGLAAWQS